MAVTPSELDANHKWYYKLTSVSNSSTDLMAGYFTDYTAVDDDTAPTLIDVADTVAFLFVQNTDATNSVYLNWNGAAAVAAGNLYVGAGETWYGRLGLTLVGSVHAISSASTVTCIVAAILDDTSV